MYCVRVAGVGVLGEEVLKKVWTPILSL